MTEGSSGKIAELEMQLRKHRALLDGYERALESLIEEAREAKQPYGKRQGRRKDWWEGHFDGLVAASCILAPVRYPGVDLNQDFVRRAYAADGII